MNIRMFFYAVAFFVAVIALGGAQLPHPNCTWTESDKSLTCNLEVDLPTNFNVHQIPTDVATLDIGSTDNEVFSFLNVAAEPLPALPFLKSVTMRNFVCGDDNTTLYIPFLSKVKADLTELVIIDSHLGNLSAQFFQGFSKLEHLTLSSNLLIGDGLAAIDVETFEGLNALRSVELSQTYWKSFDWAVFAPVAEHLERIILSAQISLQSVTASRNFTFSRSLDHLAIQAAHLSFPPRSFFDSLRVNSTSRISILSTAFCKPSGLLLQGTCACCAAKDLVSWANGIIVGPARPSHLQFTCETKLWIANATTANLPDGSQYGCCVDDSVTNCLTSTTTMTTTKATEMTTTLAQNTTKIPDKPNNTGKVSGVFGVIMFCIAVFLYHV